MTTQEQLNRYYIMLMQLQRENADRITQAILRRYSSTEIKKIVDKMNLDFANIRGRLDKLVTSLNVPELTDKHLKVLNQLQVEIFLKADDLQRNPQKYVNMLKSERGIKQLATEIDNLFTIKYKNGARHNFIEYLYNALDFELAKQVATQNYKNMLDAGVIYAMVSSEPTKCYICTPWLGTVGTIGSDVPGYPRIDNLFPIHYRCIHRIIPAPSTGEHKIVEDWCLTADRKEYYQRFVSTPEGRRLYREFQNNPQEFNRKNRINQMIQQMFRNI